MVMDTGAFQMQISSEGLGQLFPPLMGLCSTSIKGPGWICITNCFLLRRALSPQFFSSSILSSMSEDTNNISLLACRFFFFAEANRQPLCVHLFSPHLCLIAEKSVAYYQSSSDSLNKWSLHVITTQIRRKCDWNSPHWWMTSSNLRVSCSPQLILVAYSLFSKRDLASFDGQWNDAIHVIKYLQTLCSFNVQNVCCNCVCFLYCMCLRFWLGLWGHVWVMV